MSLNIVGLKILMDFVPNHSSDQHEWFGKSLSMDPKYGDYYVWQNASSFNGSEPVPPNNWVSIFRGSAWTWRPEREQFYLHQFDPGQPDLNYRNPDVKQEMLDVLTFWMDQGCDGYRMDAVNTEIGQNISPGLRELPPAPRGESRNLGKAF